MSDVKRYDYGYKDDGCGGDRYLGLIEKPDGALEAECDKLRAQVSALQSDANSWQSGYDKGREDGAKAADGWKAQHARDSAELRRLRAERDALHAEAEALRVALLGIASVNPAERGIEWAKSYASDGLKGVGSDLYARWLDTLKEAEELRAENARLTTQLAAIQGGMGEANKHGAQPEVAENTGSHAMATNQLQRQEQAVARDVDGVAAPCEASPGDDIFAWATFDGEGSYDLRLFDGNESYRDDFRRNNPKHHPDWVFPLYRNSITAAMAAEVERLREERDSFQRVGILATEERDALRAELAITRRVIDRIGQLCTTPHESKERFIRRVQSVIEWEAQAISAKASP